MTGMNRHSGPPRAADAPPVPEPCRSPLPVPLQIPAHRPPAHIEQDLRGPAAQVASQHFLHGLFLSASRVSSMLPSSPGAAVYSTGEGDNLNLAKPVNYNLELHWAGGELRRQAP